jgi:hypothetical protein
MMVQTGGLVAIACSALLLGACGGTTKNGADPDTSDSATPTNTSGSGTTGTGGATTQTVTAAASTGSNTGTGGTTMVPSCPSFEPAVGSTCPEPEQVCGYQNCRAPDYNDQHLLTCLNGAWTITDVTPCQVEVCPAIPPAVGSACNESVMPGPCAFANACGTYLEVECVGGAWQATGSDDRAAPDPAPPLPVCPEYAPYLGDACCPTTVPERCDYSMSGTDGAAGASFLVNPTTTGAGAEPPPTLTCAICTPEMTWGYCPTE